MCGISALYSKNKINSDIIEAMTDVIAHRGPDGKGYENFLNGSLWFGHRRLSIIELSSLGHQPMSYHNKEYWITFNGEIYNYIEIREELLDKGYKFSTHSDTEVILAAYCEWGEECLHRFNGMWAFVIYDVKRNRIFASRDRFGVKPLYYWFSEDEMLGFGSEIKQFTVLPGWKSLINSSRTYDYLYWGLFNHTDETMFKNVYQLKGGHFLILDLNNESIDKENLEIKKWYYPPEENFTGTYEEAKAKIKDLFIESIQLRLRADVEAAFLLSGGIDSSSIVCAADKHLLKGKFQTYSACAHEKKYDESEYIQFVLNETKAKPNYTFPTLKNLLESMDSLIWHQDEPFGSTSIYASWEVFEMVSKENKVVLDGQGADELLAGYGTYFGAHLVGLIKDGNLDKLLSEVDALNNIHNVSRDLVVKKFNEIINPQLTENVEVYYPSPVWLNLEKLGVEHKDPYLQLGGKVITVNELSYAQLFSTNLPALLQYADRNSMAHSVESRFPFLDYRLVEFILSLPASFKINNGITKAVFRDAMYDILPEQIRNRNDKMGFVTPEEIWFKKESKEEVIEIVKKAAEISHGILNEDIILEVQKILDGEKPFNFLVWRIICFKIWVETFSCELD